MSALPVHRLWDSPHFTYCGVDISGPFLIKQHRNEVKCYGALFTCMGSRAVRIEFTHSLDTDFFIQALRRVIARGNIKTLFSDNGSNFIGRENELKKGYEKMENQKIQSFMQGQGGDWIKCVRNPLAASHMGGVWKRQIRSVCAILLSLFKTHGKSLDEE